MSMLLLAVKSSAQVKKLIIITTHNLSLVLAVSESVSIGILLSRSVRNFMSALQ